MKIVTIVGCRPQFIKAAVVSREFQKEGMEEIIIHTGQHYDDNMSKVFFDQLGIPKPKYNMDINQGSTGALIGRMIEQCELVLNLEQPDYVLVYGDTNSTLAGALAANKLNIKLIHVEAGLRDGDMNLPEEVNRILTDRISNLLFCPTISAYQNLVKGGVYESGSVHFSGDVMYDSVLHYKDSLEKRVREDFILCTIHREHNMKNLDVIIEFLNTLLTTVIVVAHPRVYHAFNSDNNTFKTMTSVDYISMLALIKNCSLVITDSGGLQKEASFFEKKCLILNKTTGWWELVENGTNMLIEEMSLEHLGAKYVELIDREVNFNNRYFGDGKAGEKIVQKIKEHYDRGNSSPSVV